MDKNTLSDDVFCVCKKHDFLSKNIKNTRTQKMTSKALYELLLRSYEQFEFLRNFGTKPRSSGVQKSSELSCSEIW